jgi:hypothetical protein
LQLRASLSRGRELPGDTNPELVFDLFKEQVSPWKAIAEHHITIVLTISEMFVEQVFQHIIGTDTATLDAIIKGCVDPFFNKRKAVLLNKLQELLRPYTSGNAYPLNNDFRVAIFNRTAYQVAGRITDRLKERHVTLFQPDHRGGLNQGDVVAGIYLALESARPQSFDTEGVIQKMEAFYEVSQPLNSTSSFVTRL